MTSIVCSSSFIICELINLQHNKLHQPVVNTQSTATRMHSTIGEYAQHNLPAQQLTNATNYHHTIDTTQYQQPYNMHGQSNQHSTMQHNIIDTHNNRTQSTQTSISLATQSAGKHKTRHALKTRDYFWLQLSATIRTSATATCRDPRAACFSAHKLVHRQLSTYT